MAGEKALGKLRLVYIVATDVFHTLIGMFASYFLVHFEHIFPFNIIAFLSVLAIYYGYQIQDNDSPEEKIGDLLEFTMGLIAGQAL